MKHLNKYINEAWSGVKQHTNNVEIKAWCEEMGIKNYTINSQGEIDVDGNVNLMNKDFKEIPFKFGEINGWFSLTSNPNLTSLKNCPNIVVNVFGFDHCTSLDSLEGCPKEVGRHFRCMNCKKEFTKKEVQSLCDVKGKIVV